MLFVYIRKPVILRTQLFLTGISPSWELNALDGRSPLKQNPLVLPFGWKLLGSTFILCLCFSIRRTIFFKFWTWPVDLTSDKVNRGVRLTQCQNGDNDNIENRNKTYRQQTWLVSTCVFCLFDNSKQKPLASPAIIQVKDNKLQVRYCAENWLTSVSGLLQGLLLQNIIDTGLNCRDIPACSVVACHLWFWRHHGVIIWTSQFILNFPRYACLRFGLSLALRISRE